MLRFVVVGGLMGNASGPRGDETFQHLRVFDDVVSLVLSNYVEDVKIDRAMEGALQGARRRTRSGQRLPEPASRCRLEAGHAAAGRRRRARADTAVLPAGDRGARRIAGRKAGLQTGDYVRGIDGKPTRDMSVFEGTRLLRGQPGSKVTLTIIRGNAADPHEVSLVREKPAGTRSSSGRALDRAGRRLRPDLELPHRCRRPVEEAGRRSVAQPARNRWSSTSADTAEGPLENGIAAARLFVKSGTLAIKGGRDDRRSAQSRTGNRRQTGPARGGDDARRPGWRDRSARAGARHDRHRGRRGVFAAALDGNKRADLVGEHTLGRAGIQKLVKLPESRGLWLTYARYLTPRRRSDPRQGPEA